MHRKKLSSIITVQNCYQKYLAGLFISPIVTDFVSKHSYLYLNDDSDFNKDFIKAYDMYLENFALGMKGVAKRGVVVIDKDGVVQYAETTANPGEQVNFEALKAALAKLN